MLEQATLSLGFLFTSNNDMVVGLRTASKSKKIINLFVLQGARYKVIIGNVIA